MTRAFWTSAFLDLAPGDLDRGTRFWTAATGFDGSAVADLSREFPPLKPPTGASYLWVQRVGDRPSRVHVDLHVAELDAAVEQAQTLRAQLVDRRDHAVLRSPSGYSFCLVTDSAGPVPPAISWPGHRSRVDRVRLFVPHSTYAAESALLHSFTPFAAVALDLVVEPCDGAQPHAELEVGTSDRERERARHEVLGARLLGSSGSYDELVDPVGIRYRISDRRR